jgi:hypothetical protein
MLAALLAILFVVTVIAINEVVTTILEWNGTWANHQRHLLRDEFKTELDRAIREPFVQPVETRNFSEAVGDTEAIEHARLQVIGAARAWHAGIEGAVVLLANSVDALESLMAPDASEPDAATRDQWGPGLYQTATAPAS